jgi:hypothetical protein
VGVKEGVRAGGRNDPSIVCTYEYNKKRKKRLSLTSLCDNV